MVEALVNFELKSQKGGALTSEDWGAPRTRAFPPPHLYFQPGGLLAVSDQMIRCLWYRLGLWIFIKAFCSTPQILCVYCSCVPTPECTMVSTSSSCQVQTHSTDFYTVLPSDHLLLICLHIYFPSTQLCLPVSQLLLFVFSSFL